jgi:peptide/nickel transport system substrate-binding protein
MQNRFSMKDFVIVALLLAVGAAVVLSMLQSDRQWAKLADVQSKVGQIEKQAARVQSTLDSADAAGLRKSVETLSAEVRSVKAQLGEGVRVARDASAPSRDADASTTLKGAQSSVRDESWAVPGVAITWQEERTYDTDPTVLPSFREGNGLTSLFNAQTATVMPLVYKDLYGAWVYEEITEFLAEWDPKTLEIRGVLAQAWQYAPDGTWLRVRIHPRARFSDGEPVRAEDVIWTFGWMRNPQVQAERPRSITDFITSVTQIDDRTVEFKFNQVLFTNLSAAMGTFPILPKHYYENFTPTQYNQATGLVMGSGPFKFESLDQGRQWTPGQDIVLVRNEQYWGPRPPFDTLRFKFLNQDLSRVTAFNNGEGDINIPSPKQFDEFSKNEEWKRTNQARKWYNIRGGYTFIGWNCGPRNAKPTPFNDKRVRRAMTLAIDRQLVSEEFFYGIARPATGPFNSVTPQANPSIQPWPYDLDAARALLKEAGWEDRDGDGVLDDREGRPFEFEFTYAVGSEVTERIVKYVKDQSAKLGIRCSLRGMDWSVFMSTVDNRDYDAMTMSWSPSSPESDPQQIWHSRYIANQGDNFVQWSSKAADEAIEKGRQELDTAKRMTSWHALHAILHDEQPYTFLVERPWIRFTSGRVGNFSEYKNGFKYDELFVLPGGGGSSPTSN